MSGHDIKGNNDSKALSANGFLVSDGGNCKKSRSRVSSLALTKKKEYPVCKVT